MKTFRQTLKEEQLDESPIGKGFAIAQNRQHKTHKERLVSKLNLIQNECRQAVQYEDPEKRSDALFKVFFEFAAALRLFAEMSSNINSISTIGVLDSESIKKELERAFPKKIKP